MALVRPKIDEDDSSDSSVDIDEDLARLDQLRKNVKHNLQLRPLMSPESHPTVQSPVTPNSTTSAYFTPLDETSSSGFKSPPAIALHPTSPRNLLPFTPRTPFTPATAALATTPHTPYTPQIYTSSLHTPHAISAGELYSILSCSNLPLVIDTRPLALHNSFHIRHSVPIAIPSLILKRSRKPGFGPGAKAAQFTSMHSLRQFITTEHGRNVFDALIGGDEASCAERLWNGDVVVYDEDMDVKDRINPNSTPWALLGVVQSLLDTTASRAPVPTATLTVQTDLSTAPEEGKVGKADYLEGGIGHAGHDAQLQTLIVGGGEDGNFFGSSSSDKLVHDTPPPAPAVVPDRPKPRKGPPPSLGLGGGSGGLFQLDTHQAGYKTRGEVQIDQSLSSASTIGSAIPSAALDSVQSDRTEKPLNSTVPFSSSEDHILSSVPPDIESINPSPLPMMPSFSFARSPPAPAQLHPPINLFIDSHSPGFSSGVIPGTPFTSLADPTPSPPPSKINFSIGGGAAALANVGGGFKRPPPPGQVNKRPSAPNLRIGTSG